MILPKLVTVTIAAGLLASAGWARADEAKTPVNPTMILDIVSAPVQTRTSAFDEALKRPAPAPADTGAGEVLPDGSVRYGRTVVTVKNPCPPGEHYEPVLPGRRAGRR